MKLLNKIWNIQIEVLFAFIVSGLETVPNPRVSFVQGKFNWSFRKLLWGSWKHNNKCIDYLTSRVSISLLFIFKEHLNIKRTRVNIFNKFVKPLGIVEAMIFLWVQFIFLNEWLIIMPNYPDSLFFNFFLLQYCKCKPFD